MGRIGFALAVCLSKTDSESDSLSPYELIILENHVIDLKSNIASSALLIIQLHSATHDFQSVFFLSTNAGLWHESILQLRSDDPPYILANRIMNLDEGKEKIGISLFSPK